MCSRKFFSNFAAACSSTLYGRIIIMIVTINCGIKIENVFRNHMQVLVAISANFIRSNSSDKNDLALTSCHVMTSCKKCPVHSAGNADFYRSTFVATKHFGLKPSWLYRKKIGDKCRNVCTNTCVSAQCKQLEPSWLIDTREHITKEHRRSCWSAEKAAKCVCEAERHHSEHLLSYGGFFKVIMILLN